ncbi:CHRD domain-containing protein [Eoetvoesiella caeni]|uniref:CHRD domain-containing protein n=1 Tax=Eoetvoesiella caeni TaxID=645616 RepID=A0A366GYU1_9BURK|nr:CHRD domain-containing protein [Eoetvoesiella caeni]NYT57177.1 CHRD domain-containing protein [Eoetvoesiella caeni]RBP33604.1 CHRD domain-containing protein [Eoetvoesiella caeni]
MRGNAIFSKSRLAVLASSVIMGGLAAGYGVAMAHIHEAATGKNGPPIITLEKKGDNQWMVPANAKLTDAQYKAYKAGNLYVNVHSATHKGGEIRDQLKP